MRPPLRWSEPDGSVFAALLHADGNRFDGYVIYDAVAVAFGANADTMRDALKPGYRRFEVEYPDGSRKRYTTLDGAKAAIERHYR